MFGIAEFIIACRSSSLYLKFDIIGVVGNKLDVKCGNQTEHFMLEKLCYRLYIHISVMKWLGRGTLASHTTVFTKHMGTPSFNASNKH